MKKQCFCLFICCTLFFIDKVFAQEKKFQQIQLPEEISGVAEEFSGMALWNNRVYLLPQYGDQQKKERLVEDNFFIYSILIDSINLTLDNNIPLTKFQKIKVKNLDKLQQEVKEGYEGFEAILIMNGTVFMNIETHDNFTNCYMLKGNLDTTTNELTIDTGKVMRLKRWFNWENAGFESIAYIPSENKLLTAYEANFHTVNYAYLVDTGFASESVRTQIPMLPFRITDLFMGDKIYALNYYYHGDHAIYADSTINDIKTTIPELAEQLNTDPDYLKEKNHEYARIVSLDSLSDTKWKQVATFPGVKNNWEGMVLFRKGALIVSDANNNAPHQVTTLAYIEF
ncbi:hypothetical protein [Pinibacter soli]|uniref:Uncharacterized protein n=1 Tax=Pinibacter soli TaxID=3044211 RepID=A0ABT6R9V6_9BACT|nr:hypothetical protein [Pinibacter soli]MDI3319342.1 hypothetical protein [Pinibacter soli]